MHDEHLMQVQLTTHGNGWKLIIPRWLTGKSNESGVPCARNLHCDRLRWLPGNNTHDK